MDKVSIDNVLEEYINHLERIDKPQGTITAYKTDLNLFGKYMKDKNITCIQDIKTNELLDYRDYLKDVKNFKQATVNRKLNALKSLYTYMKKLDIISTNYMSVIPTKRPFQDQKEKEILTPDEVEKIITLPQKLKNKNWKRDMAILYILAFLGLRRSEILILKLKDFNRKDKTLFVYRVKTNTFDLLPLNDRVFTAIMIYLKDRKEPKDSDFLLLGDKGGQVSTTVFNTTIKKYANESKIDKEITAYTFRHTFITNLLEEGLTEAEIMRWTGHKDIRVLDVYIHGTHIVKNKIVENTYKTYNKNKINEFIKKLEKTEK